jgi:transposase-like protein
MEKKEWEDAGGFQCPLCHSEAVRLKEITPRKWGCPQCYSDYGEKFAKIEASLSPLLNAKDPGLARRAKRYLMKRMPV